MHTVTKKKNRMKRFEKLNLMETKKNSGKEHKKESTEHGGMERIMNRNKTVEGLHNEG